MNKTYISKNNIDDPNIYNMNYEMSFIEKIQFLLFLGLTIGILYLILISKFENI